MRFRLRNYASFIPRVLGSAIIVEPQVDVFPGSNGAFSTSLWGNDQIDPGAASNPPSTFYTVEFWNGGRITSQGNWSIIGSSFDLDTAGQTGAPKAPTNSNAPRVLLETNGVKNGSQTKLNLVAGAGFHSLIMDLVMSRLAAVLHQALSQYLRPQRQRLCTSQQLDARLSFLYKTLGGGFYQRSLTGVFTQMGGAPSISVNTSGGPIAFSAAAGDASRPDSTAVPALPLTAFAPYSLFSDTVPGFGYQFSVESNAVQRTLKFYLGGGGSSTTANIRVTAHLMDGSASLGSHKSNKPIRLRAS